MVLFESRRKLQYFTFDQSNDQIKTGCSKERQGNLYSSKQHLAGSFMADISTFMWILTGEINQKKYFIRYTRVENINPARE